MPKVANCKRSDCPRCQEAKAIRVRQNLSPFVAERDAALFLTLTTVPDYQPLRQHICGMLHAFSNLCRLSAWSNAIVGGVRVVDTTFNSARKQWSPHLHILAEGWPTTWPQIASDWTRLTRAFQSDLSVVSGPLDLQKVTCYVAKPAIRTLWHRNDLMAEWAAAIKGLRPRQTFGSFSGVKLYRRQLRF